MKAIVSALLAVAAAATVAASEKPNVVVILSDDQGWGDLSLNGNTNLHTPNLDRLAKDGASFDRFYVCPVCSPTRAEFLTGRYHPRGGVFSTSAGGERLDLDERTIADTFKAAGYATGAFGKWHNGMQYPYHPNGRGFDQFYGFCSGHWGHYFSPVLEHNGELVRGNGFVIDDFTETAIAFIDRSVRERKPFFAYLPYNTPHSPMQVPDRWWEQFKDKELAMHHRDPDKENLDHIRCALAMCENIDWNVGRLLQRLDDLAIAEDTIVVYFCDNGPNGFRWNGDMKGRKGSTDEGGVRSPLLIRWPGTIPAGKTVTINGGVIDLLPTLADLAGIEVNREKPLDGVSLKDAIVGNAPVDDDRIIFSHWNKRVSAKLGPYRLDNDGNLYDLRNDPGQRIDISAQNREVTTRLQNAVAHWRTDVLGELRREERPFVVGHPEATFTQLPARDAKAHGSIQRSNRFPNCSFFQNWTSTDDRLTWDVEVSAAGTFEVELHYTCPPESIGTELELSFRDTPLRYTIAESHDPPLVGADDDRVPRQESYVKDFKPVRIGTIALEAGRGELTLRATRIPGKQAIDLRLLLLKRLE